MNSYYQNKISLFDLIISLTIINKHIFNMQIYIYIFIRF
jgi:hypothetical protein